jgi:Protein of unknown function (DUF3347)
VKIGKQPVSACCRLTAADEQFPAGFFRLRKKRADGKSSILNPFTFAQILAMRRIVLFLVIVALALVVWFVFFHKSKGQEGPKDKPLAVSKHSRAFNSAIDSTLGSYYTLTESFVNWDTSRVDKQAADLQQRLTGLSLQELKKDTTGILETAQSFVDNAKNSAQAMVADTGIVAKRHDLNDLSDNLFQFLRVVKYDLNTLYLQQCPMAFGDDQAGIWLSRTDSIRNPYLGLHHPKYGKAMIDCGDTKDSVHFTGTK